ncbi:macrophage metalloelastase-like isoform X3 [Daktulosphaira vitifoliae]|uniref:macrophage metalloelastase-like isoform X1 n=1 Tax=Daktulosphaira vitifoliae TaxID=58002 RepID=UPI0021AAA8E9|nr:macrophage metalloelastase-like isoform X1 [Daktulosphaira vitifoliae]XP_050545975.1 macrophage metalloelastase-like isoform X2 [Daktulosphaira vitifoliae]XP_050545976.1 macrophage metalloelastase-like isoform X1 [Daktulosphaira vitifoliae]XP_050545977.1 macrophage metalloelastase-like isoform X3 [Daktulosphaira vitifoliae]
MKLSKEVYMLNLIILSSAFVEIKNRTQAMAYLAEFGYLETEMQLQPQLAHKLTNKMFKEALIEYQLFVDITPTGLLDTETLKVMNTQRCGCHDKFYRFKKERFKRFERLPDGWRLNDLHYKILNYPTRELDNTQTDIEIKKAFDQWSEVTPLKFTQIYSGTAHINIAFKSNFHGDLMSFDGTLGVFAHTLTPSRGNVHFDDSETWTTGTKRGTNLYQVALHEFGHMLGLDHSKIKFSVMRPIYPGYNPNYKLKNDDIEGIQELYGENTSMDRQKKVIAKRHTNQEYNKFNKYHKDICKNPKIDTILISRGGETYIFKRNIFWKLTTKRDFEDRYLQLINDVWIGLPNNIDAVFTYNNQKTYFFKGSKYWRFTETSLDKDFPREIAFGFAGIPNNIDSAMNLNDKIYFFKGEKYWVYHPTKNPPVSSEYPRSLRDWNGVPSNIDAVFSFNNSNITFVKDDSYYTFKTSTFLVENSNISSTRSINKDWFYC